MRVAVLFVALIDAVFLGLLAFLAWNQGTVTQVSGFQELPALVATDDWRMAIGAGAAALAVLTLLLVIALAMPRRGPAMIELRAGDNGPILIRAADVARTVAEDVRALPAVEDANVRAEPEKGGIALDLAIVLRREAELPSTIDEVNQHIATGLSKRYGAALARKPRIRISYADKGESRKRKTEPEPAATVHAS